MDFLVWCILFYGEIVVCRGSAEAEPGDGFSRGVAMEIHDARFTGRGTCGDHERQEMILMRVCIARRSLTPVPPERRHDGPDQA